jgi:hypothetical protein
MAKRILICVLTYSIVLYSAFGAGANAAAANPMIIETNGVTTIPNIINSLGGGTVLDQVPGTNVYLVNLSNVRMLTPLVETLLGIVSVERDELVLTSLHAPAGQSSLSLVDADPYARGTLYDRAIAAIAPDSMVTPLPASDDNGETDVFSVAKAIYYAARNGAKVVNMSVDMPQSYKCIKAAMSFASNSGVTLVASTGNATSFITQNSLTLGN